MECLRDYIGIEGCDGVTPESGRYVNELPGINTFQVGKIADQEQVTFLEVWTDVQNRALKKFEGSVIRAFRDHKSFRIKSINQLVDLGRKIDTTVVTQNAAEYRGVAIELIFPSDLYSLQSSLQVIWIESISIYSPAIIANLPIKIFDLETGDTLDTLTQNVVVGWNRIAVTSSYDALRIFIAYDATNLDSAELNINQYSSTCCQLCADTIFGIGECEARVQGRVSDDLSDPTEGDTGTNTFGLSAVFSIRCRYDWLVCNNRDYFGQALMYLLGAEVLWERINSERLNRYTTIDLDQARKLQEDFLLEFDKELLNAVSGVDISSQDCCVECISPIQKPMLIP